jgi:hypothetical protein
MDLISNRVEESVRGLLALFRKYAQMRASDADDDPTIAAAVTAIHPPSEGTFKFSIFKWLKRLLLFLLRF